MIKEIRLQHWKSFEDATLYIDPLTILIGSNASGKSNVLDALVFLQRIANGLDVQTALNGNESVAPIRGGAEWAAMKPHDEFQISVTRIVENLEFKVFTKKSIEITSFISADLTNISNEKDILNYDSAFSSVITEHFEKIENSFSDMSEESTLESILQKGIPLIVTRERIIFFKETIDSFNRLLEQLEISFSCVKEGSSYFIKTAKKITKELIDDINDLLNNSNSQNMKWTTNDIDNISSNSINRDADYIRIIEYKFKNLLLKLEFLSLDLGVLHKEANIDLNAFVLKSIFVYDPIPSKIRNYSRFSQNLLPDASNLAGFLAALSEQHKTEIEQTLSKYLNHLPEKDIRKVWAEPVGRLGSDAMLYCEEEWIEGKTQIIDAHSMSDGTLRFLAILTALLTRPEESLLVIEEVDNGLHPSRMKLLIQAMREIGAKRNIDILVTTHNPALLDGLEPEMMPFVQVVHRDPKTGASKITPLDELDNLPKLMASGSLGTITTRGDLEQSLQIQEAKHA
ncbi:AAA family ATPase [Candidatus Albibeggiatoa sp. nov. BB20]|uniref:AAA family ATPase n=1 Tax=Candidatus Albibeggiatoa sp. nov. BB20 TaxID=3162723 RepID=UPI00336530F8